MKYKVGDKVKIRSDLEVGKDYGYLMWFPTMAKYLGGNIFEIDCVTDEGNYGLKKIGYKVSDEMIEGKIGDMEKKELKGWELLKEIAEDNIKEGTKIREIGCLTEYRYNRNEGYFTNTMNKSDYLCENYSESQFANADFEIMEEPEEINIQDIEEVPQIGIDNCTDRNYAYVGEKINEIIKALKQLDKKENSEDE